MLVRDDAKQASAAGAVSLQTFVYSRRYNGALLSFLFWAGRSVDGGPRMHGKPHTGATRPT